MQNPYSSSRILTSIVQSSSSQLLRLLLHLCRPAFKCRQAIRFHWHPWVSGCSIVGASSCRITTTWRALSACRGGLTNSRACSLTLVDIAKVTALTSNWHNGLAWSGPRSSITCVVTIGDRLQRDVANILSSDKRAVWEVSVVFFLDNISHFPLSQQAITVDTSHLRNKHELCVSSVLSKETAGIKMQTLKTQSLKITNT